MSRAFLPGDRVRLKGRKLWADKGTVVGADGSWVYFLPDHHRLLPPSARVCQRGCSISDGNGNPLLRGHPPGSGGFSAWDFEILTPDKLPGITYD